MPTTSAKWDLPTTTGLSVIVLTSTSYVRKQKFPFYTEAKFGLYTVPPSSIEVVGHRAGSRIDIRENEEVEITCKVANAKPKADIVWYRKDSRFVTGIVPKTM
jgi:hypothetical protein